MIISKILAVTIMDSKLNDQLTKERKKYEQKRYLY